MFFEARRNYFLSEVMNMLNMKDADEITLSLLQGFPGLCYTAIAFPSRFQKGCTVLMGKTGLAIGKFHHLPVT